MVLVLILSVYPCITQSDAVVSSVADRLKISKSDILNPDADDAAVKLALAETHVIQETKKYLEDVRPPSLLLPCIHKLTLLPFVKEGVVLDAFKSKHRSSTTILIKNIPYGTTLEQLTDMFSPYGDIVRLLVPPAGTMAVVEFANASETDKAFKGVAYRRLGSSIIYLEKAPAGLFKDDEGGERTRSLKSGVKPVVAPVSSNTIVDDTSSAVPEGEDAAAATAPAAGATLFVKNLSFNTTSDKLSRTFRHLASFAFARVQTKPDPKHAGATLSMGYGFVGFKDRQAATNAMGGMQGFVLDGHALAVSWAQRGVEEVGKQEKKDGTGVPKGASTKMIVKNLPFEATRKDVRTLFGYVCLSSTLQWVSQSPNL